MSAVEAPLLALHGLTCHFDVSASWLSRMIERQPRQILRAVDGVSLSIPKGSTFSLVGESGCGKSTVARLVVGLYRPTSGSVLFEGRDFHALSAHELKSVRRRIQMIFQDPYASLNPRWRVADIIAEPLRAFAIVEGKAARRKRVDELLCHVGLAAADGDKFPHEFSGGQRQRISIARALASEPEFLVCDEPTSALDVSVQAQILNLMRDLQQEFALTYLFISHNLAVVSYMSDQVGVMYLGRLAEVAPTRALFAQPRHPYTRVLLDTIPDLEMTGRERTPVAGEVPNPIAPPPGCGFHPRCSYANQRCIENRPELRALTGGALVACHAVEEGAPAGSGGVIYLLIGLLVLALLYSAGARRGRIDWIWLGAVALLAVGGWLLLRGNGGAAFLFLPPTVLAGWRWRRRFWNSDGGQQADGRTAWFDMRFDRASGALAVTILQGPDAGRRLADLTRMECLALWRIVAADDPASAQLLEAWMNRRWGSDWRGQVENEPAPDTDREKALHILGLRDPVDEAAVNEAYRRLISANHPDRGGSSYLAAMINWARNILLDKHR